MAKYVHKNFNGVFEDCPFPDPGECSYGTNDEDPFHTHRTDHTAEIADLRLRASLYRKSVKGVLTNVEKTSLLSLETAADLLEIHDDTGISLDDWESARSLVEHLIESPILKNGV